jgi:5-methyltetrahydrofolate--homocysteine methyltransferase
MKRSYYAFCALKGLDEKCLDYMEHAEEFSALEKSPIAQQKAPEEALGTDLQRAIQKGLCDSAEKITKELLSSRDGLLLVNDEIIPALNEVGIGFEQKKIYLPQLLMSAEAVKAGFSIIKDNLIQSGKKEEPKGEVVIATVKGDIHDIGKNIVKVLLENYSFKVYDLGKDVEPQEIVNICVEKNIKFVGLSALMTTTVPAMEETIRLLKDKCPDCKVCVGGAVLTQEYADMIGADFYGKDALDTVKFAQKIFTN